METRQDGIAFPTRETMANIAEVKPKKAYAPPQLVEWGTILELTHGPSILGGTDADFVSGSFGT